METKVELLDVLVLEELGSLAVHDDLAGLHDLAVVGDGQGHVGVLLY